ncbi:hypothetical protein [Blastomonas sp.]|uniref:hypothetical protein n=1 Tax=Blastomonas sp. TaxID=1909299 RepID=UPI00263871D4|nr:hypothetical protein [Blastomonas sp.]MDM7955445.1 hypothetical protein [Blastomonas sp.]
MLRLLFRTAIISASLACMPAAVLAMPSQSSIDAAKLAEDRGAQIYAYDQAAWHSTDAFLKDVDVSANPSLRGYIVVPDPDGRLRAIYYATSASGLVAFRSYSMGTDNSVVRLTADNGSPLSATAMRMIAARETALEYAASNQLGLCANVRPNTVVLPPDSSGKVSVYVMTPQIRTGYVSAGGHYRFDFDSDNQLSSHRKFTNSCLTIPPPKKGAAAFVMNHLLDDQPTEIHAFLSRTVPFPLAIIFQSKDMWTAHKGRLEYVEQPDPQTRS